MTSALGSLGEVLDEARVRQDERQVCADELLALAGRTPTPDAIVLRAAAGLMLRGALTEGSEINRRIAEAKSQMEAIDPETRPLDHLAAFQRLINLEIERRGDVE